jgi:seryl-tRNA synthetase
VIARATTPDGSASATYLDELIAERLFIPSGVAGVYGLSGVFEHVVEAFDDYVSRAAAPLGAEVVRFPPLLTRRAYERTDHLSLFPNLMGSVHSFTGSPREVPELVRRKAEGEDWSSVLSPTDVMLTPAACYPLYPSCAGRLPEGGRTVDLRGFVFRHEPSQDPARMQMFRQREFVRIGSPAEATAHRDRWLDMGVSILRALDLDVEPVVASDPFFADGARIMKATQREQTLKHELVCPINSAEHPTAVASTNYHLDHFGESFGITTSDGRTAHSACIGFGLERVALALFRTHGLRPAEWPSLVRSALSL